MENKGGQMGHTKKNKKIIFLCYELTFSGLFESDKNDNIKHMIALTVSPAVVIK
jgi:hypothetical protein